MGAMKFVLFFALVVICHQVSEAVERSHDDGLEYADCYKGTIKAKDITELKAKKDKKLEVMLCKQEGEKTCFRTLEVSTNTYTFGCSKLEEDKMNDNNYICNGVPSLGGVHECNGIAKDGKSLGINGASGVHGSMAAIFVA